eukprot:scaffold2552_cov172-Alexandrium_tamarense.AAC.12
MRKKGYITTQSIGSSYANATSSTTTDTAGCTTAPSSPKSTIHDFNRISSHLDTNLISLLVSFLEDEVHHLPDLIGCHGCCIGV